MDERAKDPNHKEFKKEEVERFADAVASKLTGKVMSGDEFKKIVADQLAKRGN
jgi:hypothetical protein